MYLSVTPLIHAPNLKLFPTLCTSSSNLTCCRPTSSESHLPRSSMLKRNASSNLLRETPTKFELVKASSFKNGNDAHEALQTPEQETFVNGSSEIRSGSITDQIESKLNRVSKWVVSGLFAGVMVWRHDGEAVWAAMGSIMNAILSVALKRIINQERPITALNKSDPGMPSSHSQSIFFIVTFSVSSIVELLGINNFTLAICIIACALGSYLSWLRVSQRLHTPIQVFAGAIVGFLFSIAWYLSWNAFVAQAFISSLWVRVIVVLVGAIFCLGFAFYAYKNCLKAD